MVLGYAPRDRMRSADLQAQHFHLTPLAWQRSVSFQSRWAENKCLLYKTFRQGDPIVPSPAPHYARRESSFSMELQILALLGGHLATSPVAPLVTAGREIDVDL